MQQWRTEPFENGSLRKAQKEQYLLPREILDGFFGALRRLIPQSNDPLKERILKHYDYCEKAAGKVQAELWGTSQWESIREANENFLKHLDGFDLSAWERNSLGDAAPSLEEKASGRA